METELKDVAQLFTLVKVNMFSTQLTFTICCFSSGVTKYLSTSLTTCLRLVACDIIAEAELQVPSPAEVM